MTPGSPELRLAGAAPPGAGVRLELETVRAPWGHTIALRDERGVLVDVPLLTPPEVKDPAHEPLLTYGLPGALARAWLRVRRFLVGYRADDFARDRVRATVPAGFRPLIDRLSLAQVTQIAAAYTGFERVWVDDHTALAARLARRASARAIPGAVANDGDEPPAEVLRRGLAARGVGRVNAAGGVEV